MSQLAITKDHQSAARAGRPTAATRRRSGHPLMGAHDALGNRGMLRLAAMQAPPVALGVAARVPPGTIQRTCACDGAEPCGCDTTPPLPWVQREAGDVSAAPSRSVAATALRGQGAGRPLDAASRGFMEPRFGHDLSGVRIHTDAAAARGARLLNAHAFTVGNDVYFAQGRYDPATLPGRTLLAHELTHTIQQGGAAGGAVALSSAAVSHPNDASEREAESVAHHVAGGSPGAPAISSAPTAIQRQEDAGTPASDPSQAPTGPIPAGPAAAGQSSAAAQVEAALSQVPEGASGGVGDFPAAFSILNGLSMDDMLATMAVLEAHGQVEVLYAHIAEATGLDVPRLRVALQAMRLNRTDQRGLVVGDLLQFASDLGAIPPDQRQAVCRYLLATQGTAAGVESLVAFMDAEPADPSTLPPAATATATAKPKQPQPGLPAGGGLGMAAAAGGPFYPRGNQWFGYWIGNMAHRFIAEYYTGKHPGDPVLTNYIPLLTVLQEASGLDGVSYDPSKLTAPGEKPDITNIRLKDLFEIKPMRMIGVAAAEAAAYVAQLRAAGWPVTPGPTGDPGANGSIDFQLGQFRFASTMPGAIGYKLTIRKKDAAEAAKAKAGAGAGTGAGSQQSMSETEKALYVAAVVGVLAAIVIVCLLQPELAPALIVAAEEAGGATVATGAAVLPEAAAGATAITAGAAAPEVLAGAPILLDAAEIAEILGEAGEAANDTDVLLRSASGF
jgi:Domain of unknown function (DUF4157)